MKKHLIVLIVGSSKKQQRWGVASGLQLYRCKACKACKKHLRINKKPTCSPSTKRKVASL